jgi:hypothetical protein
MCNFPSRSLRYWLQIGSLGLTLGFTAGWAQEQPPPKVSDASSSSQTLPGTGTESAPTPVTARKAMLFGGLTRAQAEEFLLNAKIISIKDLSVGVTIPQRATLSDGKFKHDAKVQSIDIQKTSFQTLKGTEFDFRDSYKFNIAACELDKLLELNMVPPCVERKVGGKAASVSWWVDDAMMELDRQKKKIQAPDSVRFNQQKSMYQVFNQLIYDTDPNQGNILYDKDWKIWIVDQTRAFRKFKTLENPKILSHCDRKLLEKLRGLRKEVLEQKLKPYIGDMQLEAILARRDLIVKFFDEQIAQQKPTLFDFEPDQK